MRYVLALLLLLPLLARAEPLRVAVASNFHATLTQLAQQFSDGGGVPVELVPGSSGALYAQLVHGAPFDLFFSADLDRPQQLERSGLARPDSLSVYAVGQLVLWQPAGEQPLSQGRRLALANPVLAPYGSAAETWLQAHPEISATPVYGTNVAQAFHFVASGNADSGLVALSQILTLPEAERGHFRLIDTVIPDALAQAAVISARSQQPEQARRFLDYVLSAPAQAFIVTRGYQSRNTGAAHVSQ